MIDVDAKNLSEENAELLPVALRVTSASAIAKSDIEHSVGAEDVEPAVVIWERLRHSENQF
jgi:hypothetical protein